ncbi:MAG: carboxypeptidase-like regulatory domain-containing protein [Flavobacteriaceae bacterium]
MPKNKTAFFLFVFICSASLAQTSFTKTLEGQVKSKEKGIADVHVMNTSANKATISNEEGNFSIRVTLGDTLLFSAVQFKRKTLVVNTAVFESKFVLVSLEEFVNELDEVVVRPYNLSGDLSKDMQDLQIGRVVSATSLGLPNAHVKPMMQSERQLRTAAGPKFHPLMLLSPPVDPIINAITGRTKMLKKRVARDKKDRQLRGVRNSIADSLFITQLKIPKERIDDFMYFCEVDEQFETLVSANDKFAIWDFLLRKSSAYRKNNKLE